MTKQTLAGKRILLGVSGGIAAYKSADLVRRLIERGADVRVVMTRGAQAFVTPLTFQAVSGNPVHTELLDQAAEAGMGHIELARWAELILVAPASADFIARLSQGLADDLLATLCLATTAPLCVAPAMNAMMWANPATQANLATVEARAIEIFGPAAGQQACGEVGLGRMLEPLELVALVEQKAATSEQLQGVPVVVTAGPTFEDIDPVRYLGNRSSGKMGFALAAAAQRAGAQVTLIAGPVTLPTPFGVNRVDVRSAQQMHEAAMQHIADSEIYISAAAVADFRPRTVASEKIKKGQSEQLTVELCRNPDILAEVSALDQAPLTVGFAAETTALEDHALSKLQSKCLDMICANRVGTADGGFDADHNAVTVLWQGGRCELPSTSKTQLAAQLIDLITTHWQQRKHKGWNEKSA